ncbi:MAG: hypothetical protein IKN46_04660 [Acholeplasmatales bacterium]|nr:hypothetical protein [Acholeplasmatales bacterium]
MTYLENDEFVSNELLPEINSIVSKYLESEYSYIENEEDLEDLDEAEVSDELIDDVLKSVKKLIKNCATEYDFEKISDINPEDITPMIDSAFYDYKDIMTERFNEKFEKEEYLDEYYSEAETDY